nr:hypothetical protein [Tanacetum cinerariifolium]
MVRCAYGLEAMIRTPWSNQNPGHRFYGCPTFSPTCVNFLRWFDPSTCQRSIQIIPGLLRSRNELEEIIAMVEEKQRKLLKFLIINWIVFGFYVYWLLANSDQLRDQLLVYFDMKTQREVQLATEINNLMRQLLDSIDERRSFIRELKQCFSTNVMAYKIREELKDLQKDDMIKAMEMRMVALQLHLQAMKGFDFYKSL